MRSRGRQAGLGAKERKREEREEKGQSARGPAASDAVSCSPGQQLEGTQVDKAEGEESSALQKSTSLKKRKSTSLRENIEETREGSASARSEVY